MWDVYVGGKLVTETITIDAAVGQLITTDDVRNVFCQEYNRINALYDFALPPTPRLVVNNNVRRVGQTKWSMNEHGQFVIDCVRISRRRRSIDAVRETCCHEIAHVAAIVFDGHIKHGEQWKQHAIKCGANARATVLPDINNY